MSDYTSHIDNAIELDLMERYLDGSLSDAERQKMEKSLEDDPILADALEGLALIEDKEEMKRALDRIQEVSRTRINKYVKKRDQLSKRRSRVEHNAFQHSNYYVAAAAAVAILVCTVWVINISSPKEAALAQNEVAEKAQPPVAREEIMVDPVLIDTIEEKKSDTGNDQFASNAPKNTQNRSIIPESQSPIGSSFVAKPKDIPVSKEKMASAAEIDDDEVQEEIAAKETVSAPITSNREDDMAATALASPARKQDAISVNETEKNPSSPQLMDTAPGLLSEEELSRIPLEQSKEARDKAARSKKEENSVSRERKIAADEMPEFSTQSEEDRMFGKISKAQHMADLMIEAVAFYEAKSYEESLKLLKEVLLNTPENPAANYYAGSIYRIYSQMKTASTYLKEANKHPNSPIFEDAQWELAQVYMARKKQGMARKLLTKIAKEGNKFAEPAREALNKME